MKLAGKLFLSYIVVALTGLVILSISTAFVAPVNFSRQMHMRGAGAGMIHQRMPPLDAELETSFHESVVNALALAGIAAALAAVAASWLISNRIISPLRALADLSRRIASGHYEQRLHLDTNDELAELVESFNQMAASLAASESMRQQLLGDVTHELNTPLASIKGYMEGLQDGVLPATPETFQLVHREASRLQRLVQDLQELSRAEAGQISLQIDAHDPHSMIAPVIERMRPQFQEKGIALHTALPDHLPAVRADVDRTAQVLTNLLGNALQYTSSGGEVTVEAASTGHYLRFTVSDTGIGLAPDDLERIFQRFYRVDKSRSRASGGSGIGLTVARHLVEAQGGEIHAESEGVSKGSRFSFTLPLA